MDKMKNSLFFYTFFCTSTLISNDNWTSFKEKTLLITNNLAGWCSDEKALLIMDLIHQNKFQTCIEIGVFSGKSIIPMAMVLKYNCKGIVFGIDCWNEFDATRGYEKNDNNYKWWSQINYDYYHSITLDKIKENKLSDYCRLIKQSSEKAANLFIDNTIDFIHFDGNHNENFTFQDIINYFPKIKDGGYILLNDPNWLSMKRSLVFLLERTDLITPFSPCASYFLFRKNNKRSENAKVLFKQ